VIGEWRMLHNEELHNLYSSPDIIRHVTANDVDRAISTHGRGQKSVKGFGEKARRKETTCIDQVISGKMGSEWILG